MATIRKQAITSGILLYIGFLIGAINIYFYTKNGAFTEAQFGLTRFFFDFGQNICAFASLGSISVIYKFYPYYKDNLPAKEIDLITWVFCACLVGFFIILGLGFVFENFMIRKFSKGGQLFLDYYFWVFPFGFGLLMFSILEAFSTVLQKTVVPNFLKETVLRIITSVLIALYYLKVIDFHWFIYLFSFLYLAIFLMLLVYIVRNKQFSACFSISRVTKKFWKKMVWMQALMFSGAVISVLGQTVDGIFIGGLVNLSAAGIFTLAQYLANLVQVPQRSLQAISIGALTQAWKDKNVKEVNRIYTRSCINMLLASLFIYGNVVLNASDAIIAFNLKTSYLAGIDAMIILGLVRIIDAGTGVNGMVIITSAHWRFDFYSGLIMILLILPTNYFLIKSFGIIGSAYAQLISFCVYNYIRFEFIRRKFNMQPFDMKTVATLLLTAGGFAIAYWAGSLFHNLWIAIIAKAILFSSIMIAGVFTFRLTPDAHQLLDTWRGK
ncbi:lipopolysaccharide biosynthesis protein [Parasediminibacterium sp. JCM 36343]|uniref:lipopolysaccharide biosynthesis protein n=1 Tax=Parasediminibacterium sp. JCM 36343 TaxID=3374279 RepID=UPI00397E0C27